MAAPRSYLAFALVAGWSSSAAPSTRPELYSRAIVDASGCVVIETRDGRRIAPPALPGQLGVEQIAISADGRAVGWLVLHANGCTSYPIPIELEIYSNGKLSTYHGNGLPIWRWSFRHRGKRLWFHQETVHGGLGAHDELHDVHPS